MIGGEDEAEDAGIAPSPPTATDVLSFFYDIEFQEFQVSFSLFSVTALSHLCYIGPHRCSPRDFESMDKSGFSRLTEFMAEFVEAKTKSPSAPSSAIPRFSLDKSPSWPSPS
ncbi:hypothetical protein COCNU_03G015450 [Cocos nucifera]|uniref:Uncharacterized protein n=1 Tax=Cocos nucifera TaxID=13894 RepID=A0A8K0MZX3_COCNU|nr:hypothetical protein COCNU_03G015450 [Cocos nucifera]